MLCDPLNPVVMDTNYMNKSFSNSLSCDTTIDVLQFLSTCKSDTYLKLMFLLVEKDLYMDDLLRLVQVIEQLILEKCRLQRRLDCLKRCIRKAVAKRKIKARLKLSNKGYRERTLPYDLTNKHEECFMMHTTLKVMDTCLWYLDSGYSRHMTGGRFLFKTFEPKRGDNVTFGDGSKS